MSEPQLDQIPDDIVISQAQDIRDAIACYTHVLVNSWSDEHPFVVHFKTTQGTGKTTGVMDTLEVLGIVAAFGPRHDDINADAARFGDRYDVQFVGKDNACTNDEYKNKHSSVSQADSQAWCEGCSKRDECEYFNPYNQLKANLQSLTAPYNYLEYFPEILEQWEAIDYLLIDETPWDSIFEKTVRLGSADIEQTRSALRKLKQNESHNSSQIDAALSLLDDISNALTNPDAKSRLSAYETALNTELTELKDGLSEIRTERILNGHEYEDVIINISNHIEDIEQTHTWANENESTEANDKPPVELWGIDQQSRGAPEFVLRWRNTQLREIARDKPVFILATEMPTDSVEAMFDLPVVTITDDVTPEAEVFQLDTRGAGITRLRERNQTYNNLLEFTELALRRESSESRKTLIAIKKELMQEVGDYLEQQGFSEGEDFELGNYYGMTGSNRYEDCEAFVGFGAPGLSSAVTEASSTVSGVSTDIFDKEGCAGELRDAIHRIRPVHMDNTPRIYLFTDVVDYSSDFSGPYNECNTTDLRKELTNNAESAELQDKILDYIRSESPDPKKSDLEDEFSYGHSRIQAELRELMKQDRIKSYYGESSGGRPPKRYQLLSSEG